MEIIVNSTMEETRVAVVENKILTELLIDRRKDHGIVGNIYKGRVVKVLPGMQSAFVDIGLERSAFLHVTDVAVPGGGETRLPEEGEEMVPVETETRRTRSSNRAIEGMIQEGQEIIVQTSKEPIGRKGSRVTTYLSLPGRYLVYMPTVNHIGVSRRIARDEERARLREIILNLRKAPVGYIVRTVSEGLSQEELSSDIEFLEGLWQNIQTQKNLHSAPALLHTDLDLTFRVIRDLFTNDADRLVIDSKDEYNRIIEFLQRALPGLASRVQLYESEEPIFDAFGIEIEISKALSKKVWLKSGGYIVIDHTEALTVVDVNTGRYVGKRNLQETVLKTNLEAVREIAYQLRLRNIGGIIIIDLIDMEAEKNREKVVQILREAMGPDRARSLVLPISELGIVQISRERVREDLLHTLCEFCPYCEGKGHTKSPTTVCYEILREIRRMGSSSPETKIIIGVHPRVANLFFDEERHSLEDLERQFHKKIVIKADQNLHLEQYDMSKI